MPLGRPLGLKFNRRQVTKRRVDALVQVDLVEQVDELGTGGELPLASRPSVATSMLPDPAPITSWRPVPMNWRRIGLTQFGNCSSGIRSRCLNAPLTAAVFR